MTQQSTDQRKQVSLKSFTLRDLLIGTLMLAGIMGGLRYGIVTEATTALTISGIAIAMGVGGLVGVLIRWNPWLMCLLGILVLGIGKFLFPYLSWLID